MTEKSNLLGKVEPIINGIMGVQTQDTAQRSAKVEQAAEQAIDWAAIGTYTAGTLAQMGLMIVALWGIQQFTAGWSGAVGVV